MAQQTRQLKRSRSATRQPTLDDPIPGTLDELREELEYGQSREQTSPDALDVAGVMNRILRLRAELEEFDMVSVQPESPAQSDALYSSASSVDPYGVLPGFSVVERSLNDPLPQTLDGVRDEMEC
ncbi:MAG: hypothetical protein ABSE46_17105 [Terracidiphilus sp.]|jgi:hypothetical protein